MFIDFYLKTQSREALIADLEPVGLVCVGMNGEKVLDSAVVFIHDIMDPKPVIGLDMQILTPGVSHGPHANIRLSQGDNRAALLRAAEFTNGTVKLSKPNTPSVIWAGDN